MRNRQLMLIFACLAMTASLAAPAFGVTLTRSSNHPPKPIWGDYTTPSWIQIPEHIDIEKVTVTVNIAHPFVSGGIPRGHDHRCDLVRGR